MEENKKQLTLGSLFDGIAGFPLAAVRQGIKPVWASEIEQDCVDITEKQFPDMQQLGDITKLKGADIPPVDIISFGSPCQNMSVAGDGKGLAGEASRLFFEAVRIIDEMRCATNGQYPKYAVWENVAGAFSSNKGRDFQKVLEEITKSNIPMPASGRWAKAGMVRSRGGKYSLHDLCKIDAYRNIAPEGAKEQYEITRNFPAGHGEKSVILILQFMKLTKEEILAIRWHMGRYDFYAKGGGYDLNNAYNQCKLAVMLHLADMMATHFDEREETEK